MRAALQALAPRYDLIVIGGGITGAGILHEAAACGARTLLVEQHDFASGTSSASSKLIHGGLRYLKTGQWRLTLESVRERQHLLREAAGLVEPQPFLMPVYRGVRPGKTVLRLGLWLYDRMAGQASSRWVDAARALEFEPELRREGLLGALLYEDARTDDARLVLRLILDALQAGAQVRNYCRAVELLRENSRVAGVRLRDESGEEREIAAKIVINATGAWTATLPGAPPLRPLRGSHFVFPLDKLPIRRAVSWLHPRDRRPVFAYPWEGVALYGTTDLDHETRVEQPRMSRAEAEYLLEGLAHQFPALHLRAADAIACYAGVRPVVAGGKANPSAESRESVLWSEPGLIGITGGKLTTFRITARQVLLEAAKQRPALAPCTRAARFSRAAAHASVRQQGRLGAAAQRFLAETMTAERRPIAGTLYSMAELRWAARHEYVRHLDDLLLRRTRLGLVMPHGARELLPELRALCQAELGWDEAQWQDEQRRYLGRWQQAHSPETLA